MPEEELHRGHLLGLRRDAAELKLEAVFQPGTAGVGELAPQTNDKGEARVADEVVT
jgi:hypothetical protein